MKSSSSPLDVAVIGGSIAGSIAAFLLGAAGYQIELWEPDDFPRRKACGEGLSQLAIEYLSAYNVLSSDIRDALVPFYGYDIHLLNRQRVKLIPRGSQHYPEGYGISRLVLDTVLFERARSQQSVTHIAQRVQAVHWDGNLWTLHGPEYRQRARTLIVAAGSLRRNLFEEAPDLRNQGSRIGMTMWLDGSWVGEVPHLIPIQHSYEGNYLVTPLGKDRINVSALLFRERAPDKASLIERCQNFAIMAGFIPTNIQQIRGASAIESRRHRACWQPAYFIGDAIERLDPLGGMGMTHAIFSAESAVLALHECYFTRSMDQRYSLNNYEQRREKGARILRAVSQLSLWANATRRELFVPLLKASPVLAAQPVTYLKKLFPRSRYLTDSLAQTLPSLTETLSPVTGGLPLTCGNLQSTQFKELRI